LVHIRFRQWRSVWDQSSSIRSSAIQTRQRKDLSIDHEPDFFKRDNWERRITTVVMGDGFDEWSLCAPRSFCPSRSCNFGGYFRRASGGSQQPTLGARGAYLNDAIVGCDDCHTPKDKNFVSEANLAFAGGEEFFAPVFTAYSRSITPDGNTGIGTWTDAEIIRAIRQGVTPSGSTIGPPMPVMSYNHMSDADVTGDRRLLAYAQAHSSHRACLDLQNPAAPRAGRDEHRRTAPPQ
jgi:hypothetical protein